jgi:hypothetical protein
VIKHDPSGAEGAPEGFYYDFLLLTKRRGRKLWIPVFSREGFELPWSSPGNPIDINNYQSFEWQQKMYTFK